MSGVIHTGDALSVLRTMPDASVQCCVDGAAEAVARRAVRVWRGRK